MKKCKYCNISVETEKSFCPLCFNKLENVNSECEKFYPLRKNNEFVHKTNSFLIKLFLFISLCVVSVCTLINLLIDPSVKWFLIVISSVIYLWVLIGHTIMSKRSAFKKITLQILSILLLLFFAEKISTYKWLFLYVYPSISIIANIVMAILALILKKRKEFVVGFSFIYLFLVIGSIICLLTKVDTFKILNIASICVCSLSLFALLIFGWNAMRTEYKKKWHL